MSASFPSVISADFEGVVRSVGDETTRFAPGDEVFGQVVVDKLRGSRPAGVGVLIDLASDDAQFSALAERCPAATSYVSRWVWRARRG